MIGAVTACLKAMGYDVNNKARAIIESCDDWYRERKTAAHERTTVNGAQYSMERMGFGARAAADDANLCEVIDINAGGSDQKQFVNELLAANQFGVQYRRQLEMTAAEGTSACYITLEAAETMDDGTISGGQIRLNYVDALGFIPLATENNLVTEAAFVGENLQNGKKVTTLVVCAQDDAGKYGYKVRIFDDVGNEILSARDDITLGTIRPFAVMRTAQVNVIDDMQGYGFPKIYPVIPILRGLDAAYTALMGDIDTAEKIVIVNELLCGFDENGMPIAPSEQMKRRFVQTGEKLPTDKPLVHEITPEIRIEKFKDTIELLLTLLAQQFGYGTKKYSFDPTRRQIVTATEYIGQKQDMLQELNRQRQEAKAYIAGIVRAALWFANTYQGYGWNVDANVLVEFDDSYITDKASELEQMRMDVLAGIGGAYVRRLYLMQKYNLDDAEAEKWAAASEPDVFAEAED